MKPLPATPPLFPPNPLTKKARFADFVLTTLEESECWGPDTIGAIADFAEELGLAKHGENDMFTKI